MIVELLLGAHCRDCTLCDKSGNCVLQDLAYRLGVKEVRYENTKEKQPLEYPSAGSTFKRPEGYFAGKLIEDAGLAPEEVTEVLQQYIENRSANAS